jgi:hypothetical protein
MKIKITRGNSTVIEADGDAAECDAFMRGATASCETVTVNPGGFVSHAEIQQGIVDGLAAASRSGLRYAGS